MIAAAAVVVEVVVGDWKTDPVPVVIVVVAGDWKIDPVVAAVVSLLNGLSAWLDVNKMPDWVPVISELPD